MLLERPLFSICIMGDWFGNIKGKRQRSRASIRARPATVTHDRNSYAENNSGAVELIRKEVSGDRERTSVHRLLVFWVRASKETINIFTDCALSACSSGTLKISRRRFIVSLLEGGLSNYDYQISPQVAKRTKRAPYIVWLDRKLI